jgi:hypothetical protein
MAFQQYPNNIVAVICNGPPTVIDLGAPTPDDNQQLEVIGVQVFKYGLITGVRMRINAYFSSALFGSSEWVNVSAIQTKYGATDYFYGWVRWTFNPRVNFRESGPTRFELELENYTYSNDAWIGVVLDWPITMAYNDTPGDIQDAPVALEFYGAI